jgi:serine/threonine protein kinase/WD40 repeat protein
MTPEQWEKVSEIYHAASELEPAAVPAFLDVACDGESGIRKEVESLLASGVEATDFISKPVVENFASGILNSHGPIAGQVVGHYQIVAKIGSGGMGEVFHAIDNKLDRSVALKTLSSLYDHDPKVFKRFRNEARAAATLNHPNVATVYSVEEIDDLPFITMELIDGQTLDHLTPENGLELATFLEWFEPIADALCVAHKRGIIHRDVKPGNIMISENGTPKILDFGLAQFERHDSKSMSKTDITAPGQIIGTPSYMSPEQAEGGDMDARSDIFSFGIVMYEALTGKRPFRGPSQGAVVQSVLYDKPYPILKQNPKVPLTIARMVARCLKKSPGDRFQSMKEIHAVLKDARSAIDAGISMDSFARKFYREATTPSKAWWAAGAVLIAVIAGTGWYWFSPSNAQMQYRFDAMSIRRLSQSNTAGYSYISPDGKSIATVNVDSSSDNISLWLRRLDDHAALQLVPPQPVQFWGGLAISEDTSQVYYLTAPRSGIYGTLYRVSALGGAPKKVVDNANDVGGISPDGKKILFVRYAAPSQILSANAMDGSDEKLILASDSNLTNFRDPQYSADGRQVYYVKNRRTEGVEEWSLNAISTDGGAETEILKQPVRIGELAVLRNGTGILMTSVDPVSNLQQLYHVSLPGGEKTRITNDLNFYFGVSVDREGRNIVSAQRFDESRVWVGPSNDIAQMKPVSPESNVRTAVAWTPDGRLVFDAYENNRSRIWISDADGRNLLRLTNTNGDDFEPQVSYDGQFIVFVSNRTGRNQIWRMKIDGSDQGILTEIPGNTEPPKFSPDGQFIEFGWVRDSGRVIGRVPVAGGTVEEMPLPSTIPNLTAYYWAKSPDGKRIAHTFRDEQAGRTKVAIDDISTGATETILDIWPVDIFKWLPDSSGLFYKEREEGERLASKVNQIDLVKRTPRLLVSVEPDLVSDLSYSFDGKFVALVRGNGVSNVVMLSARTE